MAYSRLAFRLATVMHRLGLAGADDEELRAHIQQEVVEHVGTGDSPAWMDELFDAILAGRRTHASVPCPSGYLDGEDGLFNVLHQAGSGKSELRLDHNGDRWTWVMPRLNLVLRVTEAQSARAVIGSEYTLTSWVTPGFPPLTVGIATILHRSGLASADDDKLRADVHEAVTDNLLDHEAPVWMTDIVAAILHGRHDDLRVTIPSGRPDGGTVLRNILADLTGRFPLAIEDDGEWWSWTALGTCLWVSREAPAGQNHYSVLAMPTPLR